MFTSKKNDKKRAKLVELRKHIWLSLNTHFSLLFKTFSLILVPPIQFLHPPNTNYYCQCSPIPIISNYIGGRAHESSQSITLNTKQRQASKDYLKNWENLRGERRNPKIHFFSNYLSCFWQLVPPPPPPPPPAHVLHTELVIDGRK